MDFSNSEDPCFVNADSPLRSLKFTTCSNDQFTCDDGQCIDIEERCDQTVDCEDASDENDCKMLVIEKSYNKGTPPFIVEKKSKLMKPAYVNISLSVTDIINIVEVNHEIELKFHILMEWFDQRLKFQNLKESLSSNVPTDVEIEALWLPNVIFSNTKNNEATFLTPDTIIAVKREGKVYNAKANQVHEANIFDGVENGITFQQSYAKHFKCEYQLHLYPFDTQVCL